MKHINWGSVVNIWIIENIKNSKPGQISIDYGRRTWKGFFKSVNVTNVKNLVKTLIVWIGATSSLAAFQLNQPSVRVAHGNFYYFL